MLSLSGKHFNNPQMGKQECFKSQESSPLSVSTEVSRPNLPNSFMFFRVPAPSLNSPRRAGSFFLRIRGGQPGSIFQSKKKKVA